MSGRREVWTGLRRIRRARRRRPVRRLPEAPSLVQRLIGGPFGRREAARAARRLRAVPRRARRRLRRRIRMVVLWLLARREEGFAGGLIPRPKGGRRILDPSGEELREQLQALHDLLGHRPLPRRPLLRAAASRALTAAEAAGSVGFLPYLLQDLLRDLGDEDRKIEVRYFARQLTLAIDGIDDAVRRRTRAGATPPTLEEALDAGSPADPAVAAPTG